MPRKSSKPTVPQYPNKLLNHVLKVLKLKTDSDLCRALGIDYSIVSRIRHKSSDHPDKFKIVATHILAIYDATGMSIEEIRSILYQKPFSKPLTPEEKELENARLASASRQPEAVSGHVPELCETPPGVQDGRATR